MPRPPRIRTRTCAALLATLALAGPEVLAQSTTRVSISSSGAEANARSSVPAISRDGRYVAFMGDADNLVAGDTNGVADIFVYDGLSGQTTRVSVDSNGMESNAPSAAPELTGDGQVVAFDSAATNLVPNDTNGRTDVFIHDRTSGLTQRVSVSSAGEEGDGHSFRATISASGRFVAFTSRASNLVPGDTGFDDIFIRDLVAGQTERVSVTSAGEQANGNSADAWMSDDGRFVVFSSEASNLVSGDTNGLADIFVHDRVAGTTTRASVSSAGQQGNGHSRSPVISGNGRLVAFDSDARNLVAGDVNSWPDVFVHDTLIGETVMVSVDSNGNQGIGESDYAAITPDGRYVTFLSRATNLVLDDTNGAEDVFQHDLNLGTTIQVSVSSNLALGNGASGQNQTAPMSADGSAIVFVSDADNLVSGDTNGVRDAFVHVTRACAGPVIMVQPVDQNVCPGWAAAFTVQAVGPPPPDYQWYKDGVLILEATEATYTIPAAGASDAGIYTVEVSNACGAVFSDPAVLNVGTTITSQPVSQTGCTGGSVTFNVGAVAPPPVDYQ